ncbi:hypothetical protein Cni_G14922 [Canna indica]|uniref:RNase H type-1 domain-containing protein n=1 Tax=Canna indica TaxID=4628 RepID=A0AAQ3KCV3_9LILI|nr:hypothetical protein Cni_G14922 [Canna indica]
MEDGDSFYVVRKGNMIAIYQSLSDCQAQVSSSVCNPAVGVYKGYCLSKETEKYLVSRGLKNALYTIDATDVQEDLFGSLVPCSFQDVDRPSSSSMEHPNNSIKLGSLAEAEPTFQFHLNERISVKSQPMSHGEGVDKTSHAFVKVAFDHVQLMTEKNSKVEPSLEALPITSKHMLCILEFDGASKGNLGKAGAGAILRTEDGRVVARLREGLGIVTNNVAEYRALILGLKYALKKGFKSICAQGDSQLICMQVQGLWQTKNQNMIELCKEVKELRKEFSSFKIVHVKRELNSDADAQANLATNLHELFNLMLRRISKPVGSPSCDSHVIDLTTTFRPTLTAVNLTREVDLLTLLVGVGVHWKVEDGDSFYVVRKGNMIAIYQSLSDCQAQVSSLVCDPAIGVYKGYCLSKETEKYLVSCGLKNALYTIDATDIQEDLFGSLVPCHFQMFCILEFDGASKGISGKAGAGAILRTVVARLHEGLGIVTNNVAEYRALILGLKYALKKGIMSICAQGESQLICMQVQGLWQSKNQNMIELCKEVKELRKEFSSFKIVHVKRELNSDADAQANLAINLHVGEVQEEVGEQKVSRVNIIRRQLSVVKVCVRSSDHFLEQAVVLCPSPCRLLIAL